MDQPPLFLFTDTCSLEFSSHILRNLTSAIISSLLHLCIYLFFLFTIVSPIFKKGREGGREERGEEDRRRKRKKEEKKERREEGEEGEKEGEISSSYCPMFSAIHYG